MLVTYNLVALGVELLLPGGEGKNQKRKGSEGTKMKAAYAVSIRSN
ncbi:MAG: hypothetical protein JWR19_563 [Pedosphaera sp.]|nr:hypothetical protein [Pedosphaera sp.]